MAGQEGSLDSGRHPWVARYPPGVSWDADIPVRPVGALLDEAVGRFANRPFLDFLGEQYTYGRTGELVARAAHGLRRLGVTKGVKVGLFLPNCPYGVICYFAVLKAGGTVANYNPLLAERELIRQIEDSETELMVTLDLDQLYRKVAAALTATRLRRIILCSMTAILPFPKNLLFRVTRRSELASPPRDDRHLSFDRLVAQRGAFEAAAIAPRSDIAVLQSTGGTTGEPKAVMLSHQNIYANTCQIRGWFTGADPGRERLLAILPFSHSFGMTAVMNFAVALGGELVILPRFDLREMLGAIERKRVTILIGVPTLFKAISQWAQLSNYDLSSLKICISGGDSLPRTVQEQFVTLTGCSLAEGYGLTESAPVVTCSNPLEGIHRPGSCGVPLPQTTVEILSTDDRRTVLPAGEAGEICVTGPQVMRGYWKQEAATRNCMAGDRLCTGDIGSMDSDGYLYFIDRLKEVIPVHGYKVYPRSVEEAIRLHPAVTEVAVVGVPDPVRGQAPKAYIVLMQGAALTEEALRHFLADKLSPVEIPRSVAFRDSLPRSPAGKVLKREL